MPSLAGVILAGGYSTRMGKDKGSLALSQKTLLERAIQCMLLASLPQENIFVSCRIDAPYTTKQPLLYDMHEGIGPLSGIYTALTQLQRPCLFLPVDTPLMNPQYITQLITTYKEQEGKGSNMVCFQSQQGVIEALVSIFSPRALPYIQTSIQKKQYKITQSIPQEHQYYIQYTEDYSFYNVNTPQDVEHITPYIKEYDAHYPPL